MKSSIIRKNQTLKTAHTCESSLRQDESSGWPGKESDAPGYWK
ncbi:MAG: hypothetical protein OJF50_004142 [Nitrospira sp.]|nr:hypothetical protein [Nitrospira sp.]